MESKALAALTEFYSEFDDAEMQNNEPYIANNKEHTLEISSDEDIEFVGETKITDLDNLDRNNVELPPEPLGTCSEELQDRVALLEKTMKKSGEGINKLIQKRKSFRNPQIYEKLVDYLGIDELGTNYNPRQFDPLKWSKYSYFEKLEIARKEEKMRRLCNARLKALKERKTIGESTLKKLSK